MTSADLTGVLDAAFESARESDEVSLSTTLAPVYEALQSDAKGHYREQTGIVEAAVEGRIDPGTAGILAVDCGVGGLLARLGERYDRVVGVDRTPELLAWARGRTDAAVVAGVPGRLPFSAAFEVVVGLDYVTAHVEGRRGLVDLLSGLGDCLEPGGIVAVDAPVEPRAILEDDWAETVGGYHLRRSVAAGRETYGGAEYSIEYELRDVESGDTAEAVEHVSVSLFDRDDVRTTLREAGLEVVDVREKPGDPDALVAVGGRPD